MRYIILVLAALRVERIARAALQSLPSKRAVPVFFLAIVALLGTVNGVGYAQVFYGPYLDNPGVSPFPEVGNTTLESGYGNQANGSSWYPSTSADERYAAFASGTSNLVGNDTDDHAGIFVHDRVIPADPCI